MWLPELNLLLTDVHKYELDILGPLGRLAKVKQPIKPGTDDQCHIALPDGERACGGGGERVRVRNHSLPHRRREEGDARGVHQLPDRLLRARVRRTLPNHDQRPLRSTEQVHSFLDALIQCLLFRRRRI
uniref:OXC n=1 Tax=Arundo donax TaxID=35708 RepID=A0A0A9D5N4_ARUDO